MIDTGPQSTNMLGKYRLLGELGRGGMAHVYLAVMSGPARFNKLVVVKEIQSELAYDPEFVMMFLDEARLAARLNHPNVVQTNEVGQQERRFWMVMEFLEGQSFSIAMSRLGRGENAPMTLEMKLRVMVDALAGLHYAHELKDFDGTPLNVVHRDVSPHNIFVTYSGQVKVLDFGIAKALDSATETSTGVLKGKVAYMAPEHAREKKVDRRADVYAAGVVLWEIAAGRRMFADSPQMMVLDKVMTGKIDSPRTVNPHVDPQLEAIIMRALSFRPDDRQPTAAALARDLEGWLIARNDHSSVRALGELMNDAFARERTRLQQLVEQQIKRVQEAKESRPGPVPRFDPTMSASQTAVPVAPPDLSGTGRADANEEPTVPVMPTPSLTPPGTTEAAVVSELMASPKPSRTPIFAALAALAVGGALAVFLLTDAKDSAPKAGASSALSEPVVHKLRIESTPSGAQVECGTQIVGTTPFEVSLSDGAQPCAYALKLDGYQTHTVERGPMGSSVTVTANLLAERSTSASGSASARAATKPAPIVPRRGGVRPPPPPKPRPADIRLKR